MHEQPAHFADLKIRFGHAPKLAGFQRGLFGKGANRLFFYHGTTLRDRS